MDNRKTQLKISTRMWVMAFFLTIAIGSAFYWYDDAIIENIMAVQFSPTLETFENLLSSPIKVIKTHTYVDFLFIIGYSILFYAAYRVFQTSMRIKPSTLFIIICLLPGLFDIIENFLFLNLAGNVDNTATFKWYWFMVRAKWTLVIPFFLINITILIYYLVKVINALIKSVKGSN